MKKFRLLLLFFAALFSVGTFTACSDDDDNQDQNQDNYSSIVGTWVSRAGEETITLTFNANGTFVEAYQDSYGSETESGTYTYDGTTLTLVYSDGYAESGPASISGNTLTINGTTFVRI